MDCRRPRIRTSSTATLWTEGRRVWRCCCSCSVACWSSPAACSWTAATTRTRWWTPGKLNFVSISHNTPATYNWIHNIRSLDSPRPTLLQIRLHPRGSSEIQSEWMEGNKFVVKCLNIEWWSSENTKKCGLEIDEGQVSISETLI